MARVYTQRKAFGRVRTIRLPQRPGRIRIASGCRELAILASVLAFSRGQLCWALLALLIAQTHPAPAVGSPGDDARRWRSIPPSVPPRTPAGRTTRANPPSAILGLATGLGVQAFASAAVGMCVAVALIRGIVRRQAAELGSFSGGSGSCSCTRDIAAPRRAGSPSCSARLGGGTNLWIQVHVSHHCPPAVRNPSWADRWRRGSRSS